MSSTADSSPQSPWRPGIFDAKVVFCTGGSGSICSAQVKALVSLGANACIVGRNERKAEEMAAEIALSRPGSTVLGLGNVDVRNQQQMDTAVNKCVEQLGGIDFVIAGAAGNFVAPMEKLSVNAFRSIVDINLLGSFITAKLTLPYLVESAQKAKNEGTNAVGGRIIFVSSTNYHCARIAQVHACAAKAGVNAISECISLEYGPQGVTSNIIAPGPIDDTEGVRRLSKTDPVGKKALIQSIPVQRMGHVTDIANATIFLFSNTGSFINGATIDVDGGAWRVQASKAGSNYPFDFIQPSSSQRTNTGPQSKL